MDYEATIKIDESALDIECLDQASLMLQICKLQSHLEKEEDLARENLDFVKANLDMEIRTDPNKFGVDKVTEGAIKSAILSNDSYKQASNAYINAKYENNVAKGAVRSFDQRKTMLEVLTKLHGQQYFAGPKTPQNITDARRQRQVNANASVGKAMLRRTKTN